MCERPTSAVPIGIWYSFCLPIGSRKSIRAHFGWKQAKTIREWLKFFTEQFVPLLLLLAFFLVRLHTLDPIWFTIYFCCSRLHSPINVTESLSGFTNCTRIRFHYILLEFFSVHSSTEPHGVRRRVPSSCSSWPTNSNSPVLRYVWSRHPVNARAKRKKIATNFGDFLFVYTINRFSFVRRQLHHFCRHGWLLFLWRLVRFFSASHYISCYEKSFYRHRARQRRAINRHYWPDREHRYKTDHCFSSNAFFLCIFLYSIMHYKLE